MQRPWHARGRPFVCSPLATDCSSLRGEMSRFWRQHLSENRTSVAAAKPGLRHTWTREEIRRVYRQPLPDFLFLRPEFHNPRRVQFCRLLSIKTGGCPEDCAYCPQSAHYSTEVTRGGLLPIDEVIEFAGRARNEGATRF